MRALLLVNLIVVVCHCAIFIQTGNMYSQHYDSMEYTYRFITVDALNPDEFHNFTEYEYNSTSEVITSFKKQYQLLKKDKTAQQSIKNLATVLERFQSHACLLVMDNWQNLDIESTMAIPAIIRTLEMAFSHRKLKRLNRKMEYLESVLLPKGMASGNGKVLKYHLKNDTKHNCQVSRYYSSLNVEDKNEAFCVVLDHQIFLLKSKPWQCEIQVSLFMPEIVLKHHIFPRVFRSNYDLGFEFSPSSRPKIHMFLDSKFAQDFDPTEILEWFSNLEVEGNSFKAPRGGYSSQNNIHLSGLITCDVTESSILSDQICKISALHFISYCHDCPTLLLSKLLSTKSFSFDYLELESIHLTNNVLQGKFECFEAKKEFTLCAQIPFFLENELESTNSPLNNFLKIKLKYADDIKVLAFAYTSVLKHFLGNVTPESAPYLDLCFEKCRRILRRRTGALRESLYDGANVALSFENKFGSLRFVSCGSRGLEDLQIEEFVSVFKIHVWTWLLAFAVLLVVTMSLIRGSLCPLTPVNKATCLIKVLLEQGDPFPERFVRSQSFRFLICGTLLGGLVLSNAFKSNNVYNIVLPKQPLKFRTIEELTQNGYIVYAKLVEISYTLTFFYGPLLPTTAKINEYFEPSTLEIYAGRPTAFSDDGDTIFTGETQIGSHFYSIAISPHNLIQKQRQSLEYLENHTRAHIGLHDIIVEPLMVLNPLVQTGFMSWYSVNHYIYSGIQLSFWNKQEKFIADDLKKCNKSAWILPDYQAQKHSRMLHQLKKHSDVGVKLYFKTNLNLNFEGPMPSFLIRRISMVSGSGLLEWWSNLVNRTDLVRRRENEPPEKPTMSGNIQIIFFLLACGSLIGQISFIIELHELWLRIFCYVTVFASRRIIKTFKLIRFGKLSRTYVKDLS